MTPKEKAKELVDRMFGVQVDNQTFHMFNILESAKYSALIAVDEILKAIRKDSDFTITYEKAKEYYQQVKHEIELL